MATSALTPPLPGGATRPGRLRSFEPRSQPISVLAAESTARGEGRGAGGGCRLPVGKVGPPDETPFESHVSAKVLPAGRVAPLFYRSVAESVNLRNRKPLCIVRVA